MARPTQSQLAARESDLVARLREMGATDDEVHASIAADRRVRWAEATAATTVPDVLKVWELEMQTRFGDTVQVWRTAGLSWLTALLVARYGEAEYHWPLTLGIEDVRRAYAWTRGNVPEGVRWAQAHPVTVGG